MKTIGHQPFTAALLLKLWWRTLTLITRAVPGLTIGWVMIVIVQGLLPAAVIYSTKRTIESFASLSHNPQDVEVFRVAILFLGLAGVCLLSVEVLKQLGQWIRTAQSEYFSDYLKDLIHTKSAEVDYEYYESPSYHDLLEQVRAEAQSKPMALLESLGAVGESFITLVSFVVILSAYGWGVPVLMVAASLPSMYAAVHYDRIYHEWWRSKAKDRRWLAYFDAVLSHPEAAAEVRLFGLGANFQTKYRGLRRQLRDERLAHLKSQYIAKTLAQVVALLSSAGAVGWLALRVFNRLASIGDLVVFYNVFSRANGLTKAFLSGFGQTVNHGIYLESLFAFLDLNSGLLGPQNPVAFPTTIRNGIRFRDVSFWYPGEKKPALEGFDLFIPTGKIVAIVGVNGAGKTTLVKLLARLYDVQDGSIEIDGIDIRQFDVADLRRNISVLFQFPMQFHETASDSIALGDPVGDQSAPRVEASARSAGAHDFISNLPEGYETLLGKGFVNGCELSGGEWQRVALARAYYRESPIIALDEPTSFMDSWAEADWFERFRRLAKERTGLVITHRFTIAMRADTIHVINAGRLVESGTHAELLARGGLYAESWEAQYSNTIESNGELSFA